MSGKSVYGLEEGKAFYSDYTFKSFNLVESGYYEFSYWLYMTCNPENSCESSDDRLTIVLNRNQYNKTYTHSLLSRNNGKSNLWLKDKFIVHLNQGKINVKKT